MKRRSVVRALLLGGLLLLVAPAAGLYGYGLYDTWSDPGGRTLRGYFFARIRGSQEFRRAHAAALAEGDSDGAWERAVAALRVDEVTDSSGRQVAAVIDPGARVVALLVPDDFDLDWPLGLLPPEDPDWRAPAILVRPGRFAHLEGAGDYATIDAVRASGTDLAWTLGDPRIEWRAAGGGDG